MSGQHADDERWALPDGWTWATVPTTDGSGREWTVRYHREAERWNWPADVVELVLRRDREDPPRASHVVSVDPDPDERWLHDFIAVARVSMSEARDVAVRVHLRASKVSADAASIVVDVERMTLSDLVQFVKTMRGYAASERI